MARICLHGYISGKVQGVYYRQSTQEQAERLDIDGWIRNLEDERVELLIEGEEDAVRELEKWLARGPVKAKVAAVELKPMTPQGITGFIVRR
ncbi:acylphosphatase [Pseudomonas nicosulfuronedens]|uniref:acylphosphatase n=1 Tax=Pseudomonas nicosulfuronedens TaxID=2571105 RepID=A0A5R9QN45_9PSED|nr:acylphosphatase [Pseudomonas nicosulfuronedens]MDH1011686.1 acylphosphatase [Pseudomonas nicosulfuronedens]MDH1982819.1 acylphosphatase [Pseudomonas nicosulfuronedens]MDH2027423.1 acylphosphatase [Pseudomonas nicosulfuronedens]TLX71016.1 acylphosphatase [Pseudomonas nicosulfuronedens]